jgi:hypothetical protein
VLSCKLFHVNLIPVARRFMRHRGVPDESCLTYNATDHTKYALTHPNATECPDYAYCMNCMPINHVDTCWPVKTPLVYKVCAPSGYGIAS